MLHLVDDYNERHSFAKIYTNIYRYIDSYINFLESISSPETYLLILYNAQHLIRDWLLLCVYMCN